MESLAHPLMHSDGAGLSILSFLDIERICRPAHDAPIEAQRLTNSHTFETKHFCDRSDMRRVAADQPLLLVVGQKPDSDTLFPLTASFDFGSIKSIVCGKAIQGGLEYRAKPLDSRH